MYDDDELDAESEYESIDSADADRLVARQICELIKYKLRLKLIPRLELWFPEIYTSSVGRRQRWRGYQTNQIRTSDQGWQDR